VVDSFLLDSSGSQLIRYFGSSREVVVIASVEVLAPDSFRSRICPISLLTFENGSRLHRIDYGAFDDKSFIKSIRLPCSIRDLSLNWVDPMSLSSPSIWKYGSLIDATFAAPWGSLKWFSELYLLREDKDLVEPGYSVVDCNDPPGFIKLVKLVKR
jgi:hypothetical protein